MTLDEISDQLSNIENQARQLYASIPYAAKAAFPLLARDAKSLITRINALKERAGVSDGR